MGLEIHACAAVAVLIMKCVGAVVSSELTNHGIISDGVVSETQLPTAC